MPLRSGRDSLRPCSELAVGPAVVLDERVEEHRVLVVAELDHLLRTAGEVLAEAALAVVDDHPVGRGGRDHGGADVEGDLALVVVLDPEELPLGDRDFSIETWEDPTPWSKDFARHGYRYERHN